MRQNYFLDFLHFVPTREEKNILYAVLEKIELLAPSDSIIKLNFVQNEGSMEGTFHLASAVGKFKLVFKALDLASVMDELEKEVKNKFIGWKEKRFSLSQGPAQNPPGKMNSF